MAAGAYPEKMGTNTAPIWNAANICTTTSTVMGMQAPTRSPGRMPSARRPAAQRSTASVSWAYVSVRIRPFSVSPTRAGCRSRSVPRCRCRQLAVRLSVPPTYQSVHGIPRDVSRTVWYGSVNAMPRSRTTASQNHAGSSTERRCRASTDGSPWARIRRVTLACSTSRAGGRQTMPAMRPRFSRGARLASPTLSPPPRSRIQTAILNFGRVRPWRFGPRRHVSRCSPVSYRTSG